MQRICSENINTTQRKPESESSEEQEIGKRQVKTKEHNHRSPLLVVITLNRKKYWC
jgi:hypothetical protein